MRLNFAILFFLFVLSTLQAQVMPPGKVTASKVATAPVTFLLPEHSPAFTITLPAISSTELETLQQKSGATKKGPLLIGVPRNAIDHIPFDLLDWRTVQSGEAAKLIVQSPIAAGLRLGIALETTAADIELRFSGSSDQQVFGPIRAGEIAADSLYWSPVLEGEFATIEIFKPTGASGALKLPQISHLTKLVQHIGRSDFCEIDLACVQNPSQALLVAASATGKFVYTFGGFTLACTGTMLNTSQQLSSYYLFTAHHCFNNQPPAIIARTLNIYWFFDAISCGSRAVPPFQLQAGGATLIYSDAATDIAFMRLNTVPPQGAGLAGWDARPITASSSIITLHHPAGDLKKYTEGRILGYGPFSGQGSFITVRYSLGNTEQGSSGAAVFTPITDLGPLFYAVRGGLFGGDASCRNPSGTDSFSRFDTAYRFLAAYLQPDSPVLVREFRYPPRNQFFITPSEIEAEGIRRGSAGVGWEETSQTFLAFPATGGTLPPTAVPVHRYLLTPDNTTHFYTNDDREHSMLLALQALTPASQRRWTYEGVSHYSFRPVGGQCPIGTQAIYRAFNNFQPSGFPNHRYSLNLALLQQLPGWTIEGIVECALSG